MSAFGVLKYFLDRDGVSTRRMAGKPGQGHIESAVLSGVVDPNGDVYQQMFKLGYIRVVERSDGLEDGIHVDAPRQLTRAQTAALGARRRETGLAVYVNSRAALESRTAPADAARIVAALLETA